MKLTPDNKIQRPDNHLERRELRKDGRDLPVLVHHGPAPGDRKLVHDDQERHARDGVPSPPLPVPVRVREEPAGEHHDPVREQRDQDVAPVDAGEEGEVQDDQGHGQRGVDVAHPEHLAQDVLVGGGDSVFVGNGYKVVGEEGAGAAGLGVVG